MTDYLIIIPTCIFVKGYFRTAIYDTLRGNIDFAPNDLYDFCTKHNKQRIAEIISSYSTEDSEIVEEYIDFLVKNEYAIKGSLNDALCIQDISLKWNYFGVITNFICEYSSLVYKQRKKICHIVENDLKSQAFQLISFQQQVPVANLEKILSCFIECINIHHVELILPFSEEYIASKIELLLVRYPFINRMIIHSSPDNQLIEDDNNTILSYVQQSIDKTSSCGFVGKAYFALNFSHITESLKYNNCLNRKVFVDGRGDVKNCPFTKEKYGNIFEDEILNIVEKNNFKRLWKINKDRIHVCKDCEFRYICSDCRVFVKNSADIYSQPAKCNYNPYIAKWLGEEGYISV